MGDKVFINGRAAVHKGSAGKSIAFPDICLCPPTPPAGPIPTPLPNTVQAADLEGGAKTVLIEGNPSGKRSSYFKKSTGNEVSQPTGGGVITHGVQGKAYFQTFSMNVMFEGEPAVRHMDLLTHNHMGPQPGNTLPTPWLSTMNLPPQAPQVVRRRLKEGPSSITISVVDREGWPIAGRRYRVSLGSGKLVEGVLPLGGRIELGGIPKGKVKFQLLPLRGVEEMRPNHKPPALKGAQETRLAENELCEGISLSTDGIHRIVDLDDLVCLDLEIPAALAARLPEDFALTLGSPGQPSRKANLARAVRRGSAITFEFQFRGSHREVELSAEAGDDRVVLLACQKLGDVTRPLNWTKSLAPFLSDAFKGA